MPLVTRACIPARGGSSLESLFLLWLTELRREVTEIPGVDIVRTGTLDGKRESGRGAGHERGCDDWGFHGAGANPAVRNSCCLDWIATPRLSARTTRPFITSLSAQEPSSTHGQLTISSMGPENGRLSATSSRTPVLLMLQVRPEPQRSSSLNNRYSTARASGKRCRDLRSEEAIVYRICPRPQEHFIPWSLRRIFPKWIALYTIRPIVRSTTTSAA